MQKYFIKSAKKYIIEDVKKFFNCVYPVTEYEGFRQLWVRYSDGNFKLIKFFKDSELNKLNDLIVCDKFDYYITSNAFYADRRGCEYLSKIDNFVFDLDNHAENISAYDLEWNIRRLIHFLETDYADEFPLKCSAIVRTGRGIQIWVHIDSISSKLMFLWRLVASHFCDVLEKICREENIDLTIDRTASTNAVGLFRMPYTFNSKTESYIDNIDINNYHNYSIDELIEKYEINKNFKKKSNFSKKFDIDDDYKSLHLKRIKYIEDYVKRCDYDVVGQRNSIIFLYYNACVQVMERSSALEHVEQLNKSFKVMYSVSELRSVVSAVDKYTYKLKTETFFDILSVSENERKVYHNMSYKKKIDRTERNKRIYQLAVQRLTCEQIAEDVGCSVRTVKTVLKDFDKKEFLAVQVKELRKTMSIKQVAETLNISIATVKNLQKGG